MDRETLDTIKNAISDKYRALLHDIDNLHRLIFGIEQTLCDEKDTLTHEKYKKLKESLKMKTKESKKLSLLAEGMFLAREEVLNLY